MSASTTDCSSEQQQVGAPSAQYTSFGVLLQQQHQEKLQHQHQQQHQQSATLGAAACDGFVTVEAQADCMEHAHQMNCALQQIAASVTTVGDAQRRIAQALSVLMNWGNVDGEGEKRWAIVQTIKALAGDHFEPLVELARGGLVENEFGEFEHEFDWDEGLDPDCDDEEEEAADDAAPDAVDADAEGDDD